MKKLIAYVDGSYDVNTGLAGAGAIIRYPDGTVTRKSIRINDAERNKMRNVSGELAAAYFVIQLALSNEYDVLDLYFDYEGLEKWATGGWQAKNKYTQEYRDFTEKAREKLTINFYKVKSHSGDEYNEYADLAAKEAAGIGAFPSSFILNEDFDDKNDAKYKDESVKATKSVAEKDEPVQVPTPATIFFITVFGDFVEKKGFVNINKSVVGFFPTLEMARKIVENNAGDIWETCYDYAVIEEIDSGLYPERKSIDFYKFNVEKKRYEKIEAPFSANRAGLTIAFG